MSGERNWVGAAGSIILFMAAADAAPAKTAQFPSMAPAGQYMIADRSQEIALARSAAPASLSKDADVIVLGAHGYETAVKGTNGFVCLVERSWDSAFDHPEFWNPKIRGPICMNAAAARTVLPADLERAQWALSGLSLADMRARAKTSPKANMIPASGAMSFMLSKEGYLSGADGHWHPHIMFFQANTKAADWGANLKGSPVLALEGSPLTWFFIPVAKWSDGTPADMSGH